MASNRSTPGAALPDVRAKLLAEELGGHVLHKRLQDHEHEIKSHEHLSTLQHDFDYLLTACMHAGSSDESFPAEEALGGCSPLPSGGAGRDRHT